MKDYKFKKLFLKLSFITVHLAIILGLYFILSSQNTDIFIYFILIVMAVFTALYFFTLTFIIKYYSARYESIFEKFADFSGSKYIIINRKKIVTATNVMQTGKINLNEFIRTIGDMDMSGLLNVINDDISSGKIDQKKYLLKMPGRNKDYDVFLVNLTMHNKFPEYLVYFQDISEKVSDSENIEYLKNKEKEIEEFSDKQKKIIGAYNFVHFFFDKSCNTISSFINILTDQVQYINDLETEITKLNADEGNSVAGIKNSIEIIKDDFKSIEKSFSGVILTFKNFEEKTSNISVYCEKLNGRLDKLNGLTSIITEINNKTGILSINAGIVAANSGATGAGFKVISKEIKKLSENTKKQVDEIKNEITLLVDEIKMIFTYDREMNISIIQTKNQIDDFFNIFNGGLNEITSINRNIVSFYSLFEEKVKKSSGYTSETTKLIQSVLGNYEKFLYEIEEVKSQISSLKERNEKNIKNDVIFL